MKLKVCGLKFKDNITQVANLQPDYTGFIFYSTSKRFVGEEFEMPVIPTSIKKVGVFVNAEINYILEKVNKYNLSAIQLHGDETAMFCEAIKQQLSENVEVIKAFGLDESFDFKILKSYQKGCDYFLFDTKTKDYGGSGKQFDWNILKKYNNSKPYFLSGGIGLEEIKNIKNLELQIYALDVNSKFETEPGLKNIEMIKKLVDVLMC